MTTPHTPKQPPAAPSDDDQLDEALKESFPASDPVEPPSHEKLPPADAPGSDVRDR